jgi:hypothetical protein
MCPSWQVVPLGMGALPHRLHSAAAGNWTGSVSPQAMQDLTHRIGDSLNQIYYNSSSAAYTTVHAGSAKLRAWLNSIQELNSTALRQGLTDRTGAAIKGVGEISRKGIKDLSDLGERSVRSFRGSSPQQPASPLHSAEAQPASSEQKRGSVRISR